MVSSRIFVSGNIEILGKQNSLFPSGPIIKCLFLYLPAQIRFPTGGERVTCHRSKLTNPLGNQQLEILTRT